MNLTNEESIIMSKLLHEIKDKSLQMILRRAIFAEEDLKKVMKEERPDLTVRSIKTITDKIVNKKTNTMNIEEANIVTELYFTFNNEARSIMVDTGVFTKKDFDTFDDEQKILVAEDLDRQLREEISMLL